MAQVGASMLPFEAKSHEGPYVYNMVAGSFGAAIGDITMYSIDTVKTRQQAAPNFEQFRTLRTAYTNILRNEGIAQGLYSGLTPALIGCVPGTAIFFGVYEYLKRSMLMYGVPDTVCHLVSGFTGDLAASLVYVPSEVLKTRFQVQGRFKNPHFDSGFNYKSVSHACKEIMEKEGFGAFFHGYKATLARDLPFSALQFAFYEKLKTKRDLYKIELNLSAWEMFTGFLAGALAGGLTTPFDVIKTRIQTQNAKLLDTQGPCDLQKNSNTSAHASAIRKNIQMSESAILYNVASLVKHEGITVIFRGLIPRSAWTGCQSGLLFVLYESMIRYLEKKSILR